MKINYYILAVVAVALMYVAVYFTVKSNHPKKSPTAIATIDTGYNYDTPASRFTPMGAYALAVDSDGDIIEDSIPMWSTGGGTGTIQDPKKYSGDINYDDSVKLGGIIESNTTIDSKLKRGADGVVLKGGKWQADTPGTITSAFWTTPGHRINGFTVDAVPLAIIGNGKKEDTAFLLSILQYYPTLEQLKRIKKPATGMLVKVGKNNDLYLYMANEWVRPKLNWIKTN